MFWCCDYASLHRRWWRHRAYFGFSVRASVCESVHLLSLWTGYFVNHLGEFHQIYNSCAFLGQRWNDVFGVKRTKVKVRRPNIKNTFGGIGLGMFFVMIHNWKDRIDQHSGEKNRESGAQNLLLCCGYMRNETISKLFQASSMSDWKRNHFISARGNLPEIISIFQKHVAAH